jgi:oligopeptide transport system substrate-binding protein
MTFPYQGFSFLTRCSSVLLVLICTISTLGATPPQDVFRMNLQAEPESLDPGVITGSNEMRLANNIFEGLLSFHPKTLAPVPGIAKSWTISKDGLHLTFKLRTSTWSDGSPLTSHDFLVSWRRVLEPSTGASYASQLFPILNAEEYHRGQLKDFTKVGIKATDPSTLEVTLHAPCPYFLDLCAFVTLFPVPVKLIKKHGEKWTQPQTIISNGPFVLKERHARQSVILEPNPLYWDREEVRISQVKATIIDDLDTAYRLYLEGELDWLSALPVDKVEEATWHPHYFAMPYMGVYFYRFNVNQPPFDDVRVRKALSLAVDRVSITRQVLKGGQQPANFFCPPVGGYTSTVGLNDNPNLANELLDQAGYQNREDFPEIEIYYNTSESHKRVAEAISEQWKNTLGIRTRLRNTEWKTFLTQMKNLEFGICRSSWIGDYGDPNTFFDLFQSESGNNRTGWKNPRYDELLKHSQLSQKKDERLKLFQTMEKILIEEEFPIFPIYIYVNRGMLHTRVEGWHANVRDLHPLKYIRLSKVTE